MKTQSAKSKGRRLQQWFRGLLITALHIDEADLESRSMGAGGEDIMMAKAARHLFPYSVECKNQEKLNVWSAYEQAETNAGKFEPLVVIKKNRRNPLVVIDAEYFVNLHRAHE